MLSFQVLFSNTEFSLVKRPFLSALLFLFSHKALLWRLGACWKLYWVHFIHQKKKSLKPVACLKSHHIISGKITINFLGHSNIEASTPQWCFLWTVHEFPQLQAEDLMQTFTSCMAEGPWQPQSMNTDQLNHELFLTTTSIRISYNDCRIMLWCYCNSLSIRKDPMTLPCLMSDTIISFSGWDHHWCPVGILCSVIFCRTSVCTQGTMEFW